jgi:hypothetical protein
MLCFLFMNKRFVLFWKDLTWLLRGFFMGITPVDYRETVFAVPVGWLWLEG